MRELLSTPGRSLLIVGGVATGVAMITAIAVINRGIVQHFERSMMALSGYADLQVITPGGEYRLDSSIAAAIGEIAGVRAAIPVIDTSFPLAGQSERLRVFGVDFTDPRVPGAYGVTLTDGRDPLELLTDPDAALTVPVSPGGIIQPIGSLFTVSTSRGTRSLRIAGHLSTADAMSAINEPFVVMELTRAQEMLDIGDLADRIDVMLAPGMDPDALSTAIGRRLGESFDVVTPIGRGAYFERAVYAYQRTVEGFSLLALLAALFITYSAVSTAVNARMARLATLSSIGARKRDILGMLTIEAAALGAVASVLGALLGIPLAHRLLDLVATMMGTIFLYDVRAGDIAITPGQVGFAILAGMGATLAACWYPARRAARTDPLHVLGGGVTVLDDPSATHTPFFLGASALLLAIVAAATVFEVRYGSIIAGNVASVSWFIAFILFSVPAIIFISTRFASALERTFGVVGRVAAENLRRSAGRNAVAVSALAMSVAITITLGGILFSFQESLSAYIERFMSADVVVASAHNRGGWLEEPVSRSLVGRVGSIDGVARVDTLRFEPGQLFRGERIAIMAMSDGFLSNERYEEWFVSDGVGAALAAVRSGDGVLVSESLARLTQLEIGSTALLDTAMGSREFPIVGVVVDFASDRGTIVMSDRLFANLWRDDRVHRLHVALEAGLSPNEGQSRIAAELGDAESLKVLRLEQLVSYHRRFLDRAFGAARVLELLVVVVTLTGIIEALLSRAYDRRREFALIRVAGCTTSQIVVIIVIEAAAMIFCGLALGAVGGAVSAWMWVNYHFTYLLGWLLHFHFPWMIAGRAMVLAGGVALLAAYLPARVISRRPLLGVLRYE